MTLRPDLARREQLPGNPEAWPPGVWGKASRTFAGADVGCRAIEKQAVRTAGILAAKLAAIREQEGTCNGSITR
jgi:hypothetical protein